MDPKTMEQIYAGPGSDLERMQALRDAGASNTDIARLFGITRQRVHQKLGPIPYRKSSNRDVHILLDDESLQRVREVAKSLGAVAYQGPTTGEGSIAVMLDKIGRGKLMVIDADE
jgi:hypothetical protein